MEKSFSKKNWLILVLFGLIGQIAWSVENMYFNLFVFEEVAPNLDAVTLMVQLSGVTATVTTLVAGTLSDKAGNRRAFLAWGYTVWGITVALFGFLQPETLGKLFGAEGEKAVKCALVCVVVGDCVMTVFGSTANDAAFNAWVTDNTEQSYRGKVESVLSILPLIAMLVVAGGFGILVELIGYRGLFLSLGVLITLCGVAGLKILVDSPTLEKKGTLKDLFYGFKPTVVKHNPTLYLALIVTGIYGIACQIFMPYLIIYMKTYLHFSVLEYSAVFGVAIVFGSLVNLFLGRLSDKAHKGKLLYLAASVLALGLLGMYFSRGMGKVPTLFTFGVAGFIMITGYVFTLALSSAIVRDYTPEQNAGKLQGVRMIFSVLLPMLVGPTVGNAINKAAAVPLPEGAGADVMTTAYIPAPEIFLAGAIVAALVLCVIPFLVKSMNKESKNEA